MKRLLQFLVVAAAALAMAASAGADQSYTDPTGDAGAGTDITGITARNDASGGISIQVASASPMVANHAVAIFIDADRNQSTGSQGDEYWMYGGPMVGVAFFSWNGSTFVPTNPASFSVWKVGSNISEFRFNKADIGNVTGFNFAAVSISIDGSNINFWDGAPDSGYYSYDLTTSTPATTTTTTTTTPSPPPPAPATAKPVISAPVATPAKPVAGKRFTIMFSVTRTDTGGLLTSGKMVCDPSIAGKVIAHTESFKAGTAKLSFLVPKTAKGKQLKVKLTIKAGTQSATKVVTYRVK
jgi:hypothetical protein